MQKKRTDPAAPRPAGSFALPPIYYYWTAPSLHSFHPPLPPSASPTAVPVTFHSHWHFQSAEELCDRAGTTASSSSSCPILHDCTSTFNFPFYSRTLNFGPRCRPKRTLTARRCVWIYESSSGAWKADTHIYLNLKRSSRDTEATSRPSTRSSCERCTAACLNSTSRTR